MPSTEGALNAVSIGPDRTLVGGFEGSTFNPTILAHEGGAWSAADVPRSSGQVTALAGIGGTYVAAGNMLPDAPTAFVWTSPDGRAWEESQLIENAGIHDVIVVGDELVAVGARYDAEMNGTATAWFSADGATWDEAEVASPENAVIGAITATPGGLAAIGDRALGLPRPFWTATGPGSWTALPNDLNDQFLPIDIVSLDDQLVLVGASGRSGDQHPFVASSADGSRWDVTMLSAEEGYASAVTVADGRAVVAGVEADRLTLWTKADNGWAAEVLEPEGAAISSLAWDPAVGLVAAGSRDGAHAVWAIAGG